MTGRPSRADRARRLDHALSSMRSVSEAFACAVRDVLTARVTKCCASCPGWFVGEDSAGSTAVVRCDECANLNGYGEVLSDPDFLALPEACRALRKEFRRIDAEESRLVAAGAYRADHVPAG